MINTLACDLDPLFLYENANFTCRDSNKNRIAYIKKNAKEGDIIFTGVWNSNSLEKGSIKKIAEIARQQNIKVVYFTPIPQLQILNSAIENICQSGSDRQWYRPKEVFNCSKYSELSMKDYKKADKNNEVLDSLKMIELSYPNFYVLPMHEFLCDYLKCPSHLKGTRLYRDNDGHLSIPATKIYLSSQIKSFLLQKNLIKKSN